MLGEESIPDGEDAAIERVLESSRVLLDTKERPVHRGQHPKHHGCVHAKFIIEPDLPAPYRVGLFREPGEYDAYVRFSNGGQQDDRQPDAHGMAVKVLGVAGEKLLDDERHETTHDFLMVDNPVFFLPNAIVYAKFSGALLKAKGKEPSTVNKLLGFLPKKPRELGTVALLYFLPSRLGQFRRLAKFVSKRIPSPLSTRYWSTTPYLFGEGMGMKFSAVPETPPGPIPAGASAHYLREAMVRQLDGGGAVFQFRVQLQKDERTTPIEDPTVDWDEAGAEYRTVATIRIPSQTFDTPKRMKFCEDLSYTPWHALPEHRPLGGINRTRRRVYTKMSELRHDLNGVPRRE